MQPFTALIPPVTSAFRLRAVALAGALLAGAAPAVAQVSVLTSPNQISPSATTIDFEGLATPVTTQLSSLGVTFLLTSNEGAGISAISEIAFPRPVGPQAPLVMNNFPDEGFCPCADLEITFAGQMNRIGFATILDPNDGLELSLYQGATLIAGPLVLPTGSGGEFVFGGAESGTTFNRAIVHVVDSDVNPTSGRLFLDNLQFEGFAAADCTGNAFSDGFESGTLTGWTSLGTTGVVTTGAVGLPAFASAYQGAVLSGVILELDPSDPIAGTSGVPASGADVAAFVGVPLGDLEALAPGVSYQGSAIQRTLTVASGDVLSFRWNFATNEVVGEGINDYSFVSIVSGQALLLADVLSPAQVAGGTVFHTQTGWQEFTYTFASAGSVTLSLGCINDSDEMYASALLLDCITLDTTPVVNLPPTCSRDLTAAQSDFIEVSPGAFVVTAGDTIIVPFTGVDPEDAALTSSAAGLPLDASFSPVAGDSPLTSVFAWTPTAADKAGAPYTVTATFVDPAGAYSSCSVTIADVNLPPTCSTAGEVFATATSLAGASVTLTAIVSDPDDPVSSLSYYWDVSDDAAVLNDPALASPSGVFPIGSTLTTLTVSDARGGVSTCDLLVTVVDNQPPKVKCTTDIGMLWPPNHDMRKVRVTIKASDSCASPGSVVPLSVTVRSSEPDNAPGNGDGNTTGDTNFQNGYAAPVVITGLLTPVPGYPGQFRATIYLRAERNGNGPGRKYTIDALVMDESGNTATSSCVVVVPKSQGGGHGGCN